MQIGDNVDYEHNGEMKSGVIHGVKSYETPEGKILKTSYLIDTGNPHPEAEGQPELVEVTPLDSKTNEGITEAPQPTPEITPAPVDTTGDGIVNLEPTPPSAGINIL